MPFSIEIRPTYSSRGPFPLGIGGSSGRASVPLGTTRTLASGAISRTRLAVLSDGVVTRSASVSMFAASVSSSTWARPRRGRVNFIFRSCAQLFSRCIEYTL